MKMKILRIAMDGEEHPLYTFSDAFKQIFDEVHTIWWQQEKDLSEKIINAVKYGNYDAVFMQLQQDNIISEDAAKAIQEYSIGFNWTGDVRTNIDWYIKMGKYFVTCFTNMTDVNHMRSLGLHAEYLQIGYDHKYYYTKKDSIKNDNIVFCANYYPEQDYPLTDYRKDIIFALKREFKDKFNLYGGNWKKCGIHSEYEHVGNDDEAEIYRTCGIAINCSQFNYSRYSSDRLFREMACGAFVLSHDFKDCEADFTEGKHLATFKNVQDLIEKCYYWLERPAEREAIGKQAAALVLNTAKWTDRLHVFKQLVLKYKSKEKLWSMYSQL